MSLYYVQKLIYELNREPTARKRFESEQDALLQEYDFTDEELAAIKKPDIGLLYVLGVNGQLLMHYAAMHRIEWFDYLDMMRQGLEKYGQPREGVYATLGETLPPGVNEIELARRKEKSQTEGNSS